MLQAGSKVTNPRTGTEFELTELGDDHFVLRYTSPAPASAPDIAAHYHVGWHEEFHLLEGTARYELGGETKTASAGETVAFPEGIRHVHPYNAGPGPMVMEQHNRLTGHGPRAIHDTFGVLFTLMDWEARGKIKLDKIGLPRHPMKFALAGRILGNAGGYDARVPKPIADFGGATLGRLAEAMGYRIIDPKFG